MARTLINVALLAGEASGDTLGAGLIDGIMKRCPSSAFSGIGGAKMLAQGLKSLEPIESLSVMGFTDVIRRYRSLKKLQLFIIEHYKKNKPDVFIGIDAPDFNLPIEKALKEVGIKTIHYVSPKVWAWRKERVELIRQAVDKLLCVFPFELDFFKPYDINVSYVGHPLADTIPMEPRTSEARQLLGVSQDAFVLTVLPGSRLNEIARIGGVLLKASDKLSRKIESLIIVIPFVSAAAETKLNALVKRFHPDCQVMMTEDNYLALASASLVLTKMGTSTLEAMLHKKPMITVYKTDWLTYQIVNRHVAIPYKSLPNILADKMIVPELIQHELTSEKVYNGLVELIKKDSAPMFSEFESIHNQLHCGADKLAARAVLSLIA